MTKEELEKEANKYADENATPDLNYSFRVDIFEASKEGHLAGAEPREKRIAELEVQIEKIINEIDKTMVLSNMRECEICNIQDIFRKYGFKRNSKDVWEIDK